MRLWVEKNSVLHGMRSVEKLPKKLNSSERDDSSNVDETTWKWLNKFVFIIMLVYFVLLHFNNIRYSFEFLCWVEHLLNVYCFVSLYTQTQRTTVALSNCHCWYGFQFQMQWFYSRLLLLKHQYMSSSLVLNSVIPAHSFFPSSFLCSISYTCIVSKSDIIK